MTFANQHTDKPVAFHLVAGRVSIDFANTGGVVEQTPVDDYRAPADLGRWFAESELALHGLSVTSREFDAARVLRDAIWRATWAIAHDQSLDAVDLATINDAAAMPSLAPQIDSATGKSHWHQDRSVAAALATIARDAVDLFTGAHAGRIRECASPRCILLFVDTSRPGQRQWCSMERCGNIAKTRRYRHRQGVDADPGASVPSSPS